MLAKDENVIICTLYNNTSEPRELKVEIVKTPSKSDSTLRFKGVIPANSHMHLTACQFGSQFYESQKVTFIKIVAKAEPSKELTELNLLNHTVPLGTQFFISTYDIKQDILMATIHNTTQEKRSVYVEITKSPFTEPKSNNNRYVSSNYSLGASTFYRGYLPAEGPLYLNASRFNLNEYNYRVVKFVEILVHGSNYHNIPELKLSTERVDLGKHIFLSSCGFINNPVCLLDDMYGNILTLENTTAVEQKVSIYLKGWDSYGEFPCSASIEIAPNSGKPVFYQMFGKEYQGYTLKKTAITAGNLSLKISDNTKMNYYITDSEITSQKPSKIKSRDEIRKNVRTLLVCHHYQDSRFSFFRPLRDKIPLIAAFSADPSEHTSEEALYIAESEMKKTESFIELCEAKNSEETISLLSMAYGMK